jgi:hypothetical protein
MLFTRIAPHTKSKGAPDQRFTHLLLFLACASPHTKSKELHRYVLQIYYFINQVFTAQEVSSSMIWLYPKPRERASKYSSEHNGISEHEISIYYDRADQPRWTHKLHRWITNQPILHHEERISKRISTTYNQYTDLRFLHRYI